MEDPYATLGVARTASADEIRAAYRKLAKRHHPDVNPGDRKAEERFKAVSAAYAIVGDEEKRGRFDRGEIDASGAEREPERRFYRDFAEAGAGGKYRSEAVDPEDLAAFFAEAFGRGDAEELFRRARGPRRGRDARYALGVGFLDAANGAVRRLTLPDGRTLDVTIPAGLRDGQVLRLKGQGEAGSDGGPRGDALIEVTVEPHPLFRRDGDDVVVALPISLREAVLGGKVRVPTVAGPVDVTIPPRSSTGTRLRLKGRGVAGGDQYVELRIVVPPQPEPELEKFLEGWTPRGGFDPRGGMGGS